MIANLQSDDSPAARMLEMIERCAPMLMRVGGGAVAQEYGEDRVMPNRLSPEQKAKALELAATGKYTGTEIAALVGSTQSGIFKFCSRCGIKLPDGRAKRYAK